jgi:hypothetical protein
LGTRALTQRTVRVAIARPPAAVHAFVSDPWNLPRWAAGLCTAVAETPEGWVVDTPGGPAGFRFADPGTAGVLDHYVRPRGGPEIMVPMRVVPSGTGSEVQLTLVRAPGVSDARFDEDAGLVERDLRALTALLEAGSA